MYPTHTINNREMAFLVEPRVLLPCWKRIQPKKQKLPGINLGRLAEVEEPQASFSYPHNKNNSTGTKAMAKITGCLL